MSNRALSAVWSHSKASGAALLVLLCLADHADDTGLSWPGITRIAERTRFGKRYVRILLRELENLGELQIDRGMGRKTSRYSILMSEVNSPSPLGKERVSGESPLTSEVNPPSPGGESPLISEVNPSSPKPLMNPSIKSIKESSKTRRGKSPPATALSDTATKFIQLFGARRFRTPAQVQAFRDLEAGFSPDAVLAAGSWAAVRGLTLGAALGAVRTALEKNPSWTSGRGNGRDRSKSSSIDIREDLEKLARELSDDER